MAETAGPAAPVWYALAGLRWRSALALPELPVAPCPPGEPDVVVRVGPVEPRLEGGRGPGAVFQATARACLFEFAGVARYRVQGGRQIVVQPLGDDGASVRAFLYGPVLAALCHQRGLLALRASAVSAGSGAVALAGSPGRGKSTLAARLRALGHEVLADDLCVLAFDATGRPLVEPGVPRLRLWPDALAGLALDTTGCAPERPGSKRLLVPVSPRSASLPLRQVYLLEHPALAPALEPLPAVAAVRALATHTASRALLEAMGADAAHMARVMAVLAASVGVWRFALAGDPVADAERLAAALRPDAP